MSSRSNSLISVAPSFDEPVEMLAACHGKLLAQLDTLERLLRHLDATGADESAAQAAVGLMRYFDMAAPHHHADEEQDLLPALREALPPGNRASFECLAKQIRDEHAQLTVLWQRLRVSLSQLSQTHGHLAVVDRDTVKTFCSLYRAHLELEESKLLPLAVQTLADDVLARIGNRMTARRSSNASKFEDKA